MLDEVKAHFRAREGYWFVPKWFGFGATPVTWQGWALTAGLLAALVAAARLLPGGVPRIIVCIALIAAYGVVAANKTDGGLRWRWGNDEDR
ncbi:hypothetical protein PX554_01555 [Sphingomonas sp. H39-1-10]|uniref:hypothetical protein n=1 Tax=Sphingomonas pollutisoli TaxID=3030829 RepID=UPI0023B8CF1B|nr:hypothetical protein [Sphingomonas pollutisoli]MDF0486800.1 hypothetical protein [Sphingomonas pollutisoli]